MIIWYIDVLEGVQTAKKVFFMPPITYSPVLPWSGLRKKPSSLSQIFEVRLLDVVYHVQQDILDQKQPPQNPTTKTDMTVDEESRKNTH